MSDPVPWGFGADRGFFDLSPAQWASWGVVVTAGALWLAAPFERPLATAIAVVVAVGALGPRDCSGVDQLVRVGTFLARGRWTYTSFVDDGGDVVVTARGRRRSAVRELEHRGRLDLGGRLEELGRELASVMERTAVAGQRARVSWHLVAERVTVLSTPARVAPAGAWRPLSAASTAALFGCCPGATRGWLFERWRYLRTPVDVRCVFEVTGLNPTGAAELFRRLAPLHSARDVAVLVDVLPAARAERVAARQAHRWRADVALMATAGFRRRATQARRDELLGHREDAVARGRALGGVRAFITVRAPTLASLEDATRSLREDARRFGAVVRRGDGRHARWHSWCLPGTEER